MTAIQYLITAIVVALAIGYAAHRVRQTVKRANDPCWGCTGCPLKKQQQNARSCACTNAQKRPKACPEREKLRENLAE